MASLSLDVDDRVLERLEQLARHRATSLSDLLAEALACLASGPATAATAPPQATFSSDTRSLAAVANLEAITTKCLDGLGCTVTACGAIDNSAPGDLSGWSSLALSLRNQWVSWVDFRLIFPAATCAAIFEVMSGTKAGSPADLLDVAKEVTNIVQGAIKAALEKDGALTLMPFLAGAAHSKAEWADVPNEAVAWSRQFETQCGPIGLLIVESPSASVDRSPAQLKPFDVLVETIFTDNEGRVPLMHAGIALTEKYIAKLLNMQRDRPRMHVNTVRPSELTMALVTRPH